jgi:hypothetical protein
MGNGLYVCSKSPSKQGCVNVTNTVDHSVFILFWRPLIEGVKKQSAEEIVWTQGRRSNPMLKKNE